MVVTLVTPEGAAVALEPDVAHKLGVIAGALTVSSIDTLQGSCRFHVQFDVATVERIVDFYQTALEAPCPCSDSEDGFLNSLANEDLLALLRASKWLECDALLDKGARACARLLSGKHAVELCSDWEMLEGEQAELAPEAIERVD